MKLIKKNGPNHYNGRNGWKADTIVFHQTGGTSVSSALNYYMNPNAQCSPHFVIDTNGDVYQLVELDNGAWANGTAVNSSDKKNYGYSLSEIVRARKTNANYYTYSIEFVHCQWGNINESQIAAAVELIKTIIIPHMNKCGVAPKIDREHLIGHSHVTPKTRDPERYNCPGKQFPYDEIISRILGKTSAVTTESNIAVGTKVRIKQSADTYAGMTKKIPDTVKSKTYTVSKVMTGKVLLKEIFSWVGINDVEKV